jgi:hypothetical protein
LLGNRMRLVAPADSTVHRDNCPGLRPLAALGDGRLAMGNIDSVPAGKYGKAALEALGVWDKVEGKVAQAENVRAALALVSPARRRSASSMSTDAAADPQVKVTVDVFPDDTHPPIVYPVAVTHGVRHARRSRPSWTYLQSASAKGQLRRAGLHGSEQAPPIEGRLIDGAVGTESGRWTAVRLSLGRRSGRRWRASRWGIAIAWLLARGRFWGKSLLNGIVHLPLILPPVVTGYLLLDPSAGAGRSDPSSMTGSASSFPFAGRGRRWPARSWAFR